MADADVVWIACDHGGYEAKKVLEGFLAEKGVAFNDMGCHAPGICRYPHYASMVAGAVSEGRATRGILLCSTGIGMSIIANKYKGVRAALCASAHNARMTRLHNDSNILCLGGQTTGAREMLEIVETWLGTGYEGGRHDISLDMIRQAEDAMLSAIPWASPDPRA